MLLPIVAIDAFADRLFGGNPAAVVRLPGWLPDDVLQAVAAENNLSETAYLVPDGPLDGAAPGYALRWFTPAIEVDLCGHATLAAAAYLLDDVHPGATSVQFSTRSGRLTVRRGDDGLLLLDFPAEHLVPVPVDPAVVAALRAPVEQTLHGTDLVAVLGDADAVRALAPDLAAIARLPFRGVVVTAAGDPGTGIDLVSRWFGPQSGVPEDPVTGSAHCALAPYWAARLGRTRLVARQESARGGTVHCSVEGERVVLGGTYARYLTGTITLPD